MKPVSLRLAGGLLSIYENTFLKWAYATPHFVRRVSIGNQLIETHPIVESLRSYELCRWSRDHFVFVHCMQKMFRAGLHWRDTRHNGTSWVTSLWPMPGWSCSWPRCAFLSNTLTNFFLKWCIFVDLRFSECGESVHALVYHYLHVQHTWICTVISLFTSVNMAGNPSS